MHSSAPWSSLLSRALMLGCAFGLVACSEPPPEPTAVDDDQALFKRPVRPKRDPNSPFRDPAREPPAGREGEQVPDDQLEAMLESARADVAAGRSAQAGVTLRECANKTPASGRCDGELGVLLFEFKNRRAEADYYLREAIAADDPKADAELYDRISEACRKHANLEDALAAVELAIKREDTAERHHARSRILQSLPDRREEAADELAYVREAGGGDEKTVFEEAVLRSQVSGQLERSLALYEQYQEATKDWGDDKLAMPRAELEMRISDLKGAIKAGPGKAGDGKPVAGGI